MCIMLCNFKELRLSLGLTQFQLASQSGVSLPTIQNIEAGKANPSLDVLEKLLEGLGLKLKIDFPDVDVEMAIILGVPLSARSGVKVSPTKELLKREVRKWTYSLNHSTFTEREELAFVSFLCAVKDHWPSFYTEIKCPIFEEKINNLKNNGHLIKLRRIAISNLSKYL